jgi:glycosyltransferase involved in cell wall biosynthesis
MVNKPTISICTIVKNEERQIADFLSNLINFADEIIIADTGSSDKTLDIIKNFSKKYNNIKLYEYKSEVVFHYGKAKNFSIQHATKDFLIILDADERLSNNFKTKIRDFLVDDNLKVVKIKRVDEIIPHLIDYPERIVKNNLGISYSTDERDMVHENLDYSKKVDIFEEPIWHQQRWNHYIYRPQRIFFQLELQVERTPKTKSLFGHILRGLWYFNFRFKKLYFKRKLYKDGNVGFKYAYMRALDAFLIEFFVGLKPSGDKKYWDNKK